ncbi:NAD(P)-dependent oxidoreductase [Micrococcus sp.]|uniref:NAD(P)-dependent oxidoreductase n=1 Tax=Micrococcus sp. TaxID=1271 RepID=UPI0026DB33E4|nr:NAD(P)-binding oxidoreductase [Micrococcus sp.]MDO4239846.1 SDR family oxidoreductase [Micrococcus sp.]
MRITVIGGSGGTGAELVTAALADGHEVTVVSRGGRAPEGAAVVAGSATDLDVARRAVAGADAVVVTVGGAKGVPLSRTQVTGTVVRAMQAEGVRRLAVQSSLGTGGSARQLRGALRWITPVVLAGPLRDHTAQEKAVRSSGLDWTIVRPAGLKDAPATGEVTVLRDDESGSLGGTVHRADVARFLLNALTEEDTVGHTYGISG